MFTRSRTGSNRASSGGSVRFGPSGGVQISGRTPFGTYTAPKRSCGGGAARAAGTIASSNGSPTVKPTAPRKTARREMCFFVTNIVVLPNTLGTQLGTCCLFGIASARRTDHAEKGNMSLSIRGHRLRWLAGHTERHALHDAEHERAEAIVVLGGAARERVSHELLRHRADEEIGATQDRVAQRRRTRDFGAVREFPGGVDRAARVRVAPPAHRVEVLERE